ncbi:MAG: hypothetical protein COV72_05705 [Candidatus Omnitrophica bacterium CG11_big_fil_rev_8_21_14_0_20_42_13]|uniref:Uncharacterized protein n=1 Tax=Candidatus Ghiorseimicrobium undicola TaxID=1974746 RepID=A0A2H0LX08_9BACT|nr:MAG: hypothetical protein COV72_05705 [Candidatus Omnitrophica bacterium CG11_big_fil_rev_8_21_14_0_20_42_13]
MGIKYKITPRIISYIVRVKKRTSEFSCRKIALLVSKKFRVNVSKSAVNKVLQQAELTSKIGRRPRKDEGLQLIDKNQELVDMAGCVFLLAADDELKLSERIVRALFPEKSDRIIVKKILYFRALLLIRLFNITSDNTNTYINNALWMILGQRINQPIISRFSVKISELLPGLDLKKLKADLVRYAHFGLIDGSVFYIDAQFKCIWPSPDMPDNLITTSYISNSYIKSMFLKSRMPIILLCPGKDITKEVCNFILSCQGVELKNISRILLHGGIKELAKFSYIPVQKRKFIFGLFPQQQAKHRIHLERLVRSVKGFSSDKKEYFIQDGRIILSQHLIQQDITLRAGLLKNHHKDRSGILMLTNIPREEKSIEDIALMYLNRWPEPEQSFRDINAPIRKAEINEEITLYNYNIYNTLDNFLDAVLETLNFYNKARFFSPASAKSSLSDMKEAVYALSGRFNISMGKVLIELLLTRSHKINFQDLSHAAVKLNEADLDFFGKRLVLQVKLSKHI